VSKSEHHTSPKGQSRPAPRLAGAVLSLSAIALCSKVFGWGEKFVIAHFFGTSGAADVFFASTTIILSLVYLVKELVYPCLLPVLSQCLQQTGSEFFALFRMVFVVVALLMAGVAALLVVFAEQVTSLCMPGFSGEKYDLTVSLLRTLGPVVPLLGLTMVSATALNARRHFVQAAWPEALLKFLSVVALVALAPSLGIRAYPVGLMLGAASCLTLQLYYLPESRQFLQRFRRSERLAESRRKVLLLMSPLLLGILFSHFSGLIDNLLASRLPDGQLSFLGYGKKLLDAILLIGPVALVTVMFSQLSHLASTGDREGFKDLMARAFRFTIYLSLPATCLLLLVSQTLVWLLLQRGAFTEISTSGTASALSIYLLGLITFSLEPLLVHGFFSLSNTKTPVKLGILGVILDIILALLLIGRFEYLGIAAALLISKTLKVLSLVYLLDRRLDGALRLGLGSFLLKQAVIGTGVCVAVLLALKVNHAPTFLATLGHDLVLPSLSALIAFLLCSYLTRSDELKLVTSLVKRITPVSNVLAGISTQKTALLRLCRWS